MQNKNKVNTLISRFEKQKAERVWVDNVLQRIADNIYIHKGDFTTQASKGTISTSQVYSNVAIEASSRLASYIVGGLTNTSSKWFGLKLSNKTKIPQQWKAWLDLATNKMLDDVFNSSESGFSSSIHEFFWSNVTLGTSAMLVEDLLDDGIRFSNIHLSEVYILEDSKGLVDTVFRVIKMTIRQAAQQWGVEALHPSIAKKLDKEPDCLFSVLHVVEPRKDYMDGAYEKFEYEGCYIDLDNKFEIKCGYFYELPYVISRFSKRTGEVYGRGPAWDCLPAVQMINQQEKALLKAQQLKNSPPMLMTDDGIFGNLKLTPNMLIAGGIDPVSGGDLIRPLNIGGDLQSTERAIERAAKVIKETFFVDQLYFQDGTPITATEAVQRQEDRARSLSPHVSRAETEALNPIIEIVFGIMLRRGDFGPLPEALPLDQIEVEYLSPVAKLNKMQDVQAVQRWVAAVGPLAQIDPSALDGVDVAKFSRYSAECTGTPAFLIRSDEELAQMKSDRSKQAQMNQNLQMAQLAGQMNQPLQ